MNHCVFLFVFFKFLSFLHFFNFAFLITVFLCNSTLWDLTVLLPLSASFASALPNNTRGEKKVLSVDRFTLTHTCCYSQVSSTCACQFSFMAEPINGIKTRVCIIFIFSTCDNKINSCTKHSTTPEVYHIHLSGMCLIPLSFIKPGNLP